MGRRGPPRTPTAQLRARGSTLVGRNPNEPTPARGKPRCPAWLPDDLRADWRRIANLCESMAVMTRVDGESLARYCVLWHRWRQAEQLLREKGSSFEFQDRGQTVTRARPEVREAQGLATALLRLEQEFGLTPAARSRISVEAAAPQLERKKDKDKSRFFALPASG